MSANPVEVRLARLEGSYEQIDRRLGTIEERLGRLESKVDATAMELRRDIGGVNGRVHTILYGVIVAILIPVVIRVFFP